MAKKAVYAGSFDPLTNGHLWMLQKGAELFDEMVVTVAINADKKTAFSLEERLEVIQREIKPFPNLSVTAVGKEYTAKYARRIGAQFMLRGIRSPQDFEYERNIREVNSGIDSEILSVFLTPPPELSSVSSSLVKGLVGYENWEEVVEKYVPPTVYQKFLEKFNGYFERWKALWSQVVPESDSAKVYHQIISCYSGQQRFYHNFVHIAHSLQEFDAAKSLAKDPLAVEMAIFLHDLIYDTHLASNEEDSAEAAEELLGSPQRCSEFSEKVKSLIMATALGAAHYGKDEQLMSDINLASLGYAPDVFERNNQDIREEYAWVPEETFNIKRAEILQGFLDQPSIYYTKHFQRKYEKQAQENLKRAIIYLSRRTAQPS